jgi:hypothetical protein
LRCTATRFGQPVNHAWSLGWETSWLRDTVIVSPTSMSKPVATLHEAERVPRGFSIG